MKNAIVNIYKTLFFFDFAIVVAYYLPVPEPANPALAAVFKQGASFAVVLLFTLVFAWLVERKKLKILNSRHLFRHYSIGLLCGVIPLGVTVGLLWVFRRLAFTGKSGADNLLLWLLALLLEAAANEFLLRGYLFRLYRKYYNLPVTVGLLSVLYLSLNLATFRIGKTYALNLIALHLICCLLAEYTHSLLAPIVARFCYHLFSAFTLGSLSILPDLPHLLTYSVSGSPRLTGGERGLEGSLLLLLLQLGVCLYFAKKFWNGKPFSLPRRTKKRIKR